MCSTGTGSVSPSQIQSGTVSSTRSARSSTGLLIASIVRGSAEGRGKRGSPPARASGDQRAGPRGICRSASVGLVAQRRIRAQRSSPAHAASGRSPARTANR